MVEPSEGVPSKAPVMKKKLSQSADAKKHLSSAKAKHHNKAKVVKEEQEIIKEFLGEFSDVDVLSLQAILGIVGTIGLGLYALWKNMGNDDSNMSKNQKIKKAQKLKDKYKDNEKIIDKAESVGEKLKNKINNMDKDMSNKNF